MRKKNIDFGSLHFEINETEKAFNITVRGVIDENFRQEDVPRPVRKAIHLHLKDVEHFNSCGIRAWIHLIQDLSKHGTLQFHECSVAVVDQINMIPNSLGGGIVHSFFAPYYCSCGRDCVKLVQVGEHLNHLKKLHAPKFSCECGRDLEFDAIEESYFHFVIGLPIAS